MFLSYLPGMNIFVAFFLLLLLLADSTPPAASSVPLIGCLINIQSKLYDNLKKKKQVNTAQFLDHGLIFHRCLFLPEHGLNHFVDVLVRNRYQFIL